MAARFPLALTAALLIGSSAEAYVSTPDSTQIAQAAKDGRKLAEPHEGYNSKDYVIYQAPNMLALDPANGNIDAIVLGTPIERTRHASFIAAYSGQNDTPAIARKKAALPDGWIQIILFAHSSTRKDEDFQDKFGPARLQIADRFISPSSVEHSDSDLDVYPRAPRDGMRFIGTITYKFDLKSLSGFDHRPVRLIFDDATSKHFDLPIELSRYK